ncbi:antibiotic biosynthesis monooxygenase, partial [Limnohabitans sp.]
MFSAAFIWEPGSYDAEFNELNAIIDAVAKASPGFIGVEEWASDDGKRRNATYYWETMDGLKALGTHPSHIEAKQK